jgi:diguanylate cyclase (GGDEF)-like protein/PAS domain S-box-containing protein
MDHLPAAAFIKSEQGRTLYVNRYLAEIIGQRSWLGKSTQELFPIEIARQMIEDDLRALGGGPVVVEEQVPDDEGCVRTFQTHKFRIHRPGQGPLLGAISLDITERKRMDDALRASEAKYRALIETTATGYLIIDGQGRVVDANLEYVRLAGYRTLDEILGRPVTDWTAPAERQRNEDAVAQCARQGYIRNLMMDYLGADGRTTTVEINATVVGAGDELRIVSLCRDVTERRQIEEQVRQLAFYDALTQLPNRRLLYDRLSQALSASKRSGRWGALMVFDLDHFKELNDRHSHSVGDLWLVEVAQRVRRCVRETDTVARFGGDEFVVVLGELDADAELAAKAAAVVAEKIRTALAQPFAPAALPTAALAAPIECHCTASLGVAMFIDDRVSQDEIFRCADLAMYHAKDAGRDRIWFHATEG